MMFTGFMLNTIIRLLSIAIKVQVCDATEDEQHHTAGTKNQLKNLPVETGRHSTITAKTTKSMLFILHHRSAHAEWHNRPHFCRLLYLLQYHCGNEFRHTALKELPHLPCCYRLHYVPE